MKGWRRVLVLGALVLGACGAPGAPAANWAEVEADAPSQAVVFKLALIAVQGQGYPVSGTIDRGSGAIETGWYTNLQPFQGAGYRVRTVLEIQALSERRFRLRAHVQRQTNEAIVSPLDPTRAEWKWREDDLERARILLQHVRSALEGTAGPARG
jgi:hypothetical protein